MKHKAEQFNLFKGENMFKHEKRQPAFEDTDPMLFGKHKGILLQDVPAHYFRWLWTEGDADKYSKSFTDEEFATKMKWIQDKIKLANYIWNSKEAIEQELGDTFI